MRRKKREKLIANPKHNSVNRSIFKHSIGQYFDPHQPEVELADLKHNGYKFQHSKPNFDDLDEGHFDQHNQNRGVTFKKKLKLQKLPMEFVF